MVTIGGSIHKPVWVPNEVTGRLVLNRLLGRELIEPSPNIKIAWMSFISVSLTFSVVLLSTKLPYWVDGFFCFKILNVTSRIYRRSMTLLFSERYCRNSDLGFKIADIVMPVRPRFEIWPVTKNWC